MVDRCYKEVDVEMNRVLTERGEKIMRRYYGKINPHIWGETRWIEGLFKNIKESDPETYYRFVKLKEAKPKYLELSGDRARLLLIYRMENGKYSYPNDFYDPYLIPVIEYSLSRCREMTTIKEGDYFYADEVKNDGGASFLSFILGYDANSKEKRRLNVYRLLFEMKRLVRIERKNGNLLLNG